MAIEDYLTPGEEIRFSSSTKMRYGEKQYQVFITNKRLIMYARRGKIIKSDDAYLSNWLNCTESSIRKLV